jgi:hypothetical protein
LVLAKPLEVPGWSVIVVITRVDNVCNDNGVFGSLFEGTTVRVAPDGVRAFRNTSASEDLYFIFVQAKENSLTQCEATDAVIAEQSVKWGKSVEFNYHEIFL